MHRSKLCYCTLLLILSIVAVSCGGGEKEQASTPTPTISTPAGGGNVYDPSKATATLTGKVNYEGAKPTLARLQMSADPFCAKAHTEPVIEQTVQVNDNGTLKDVFVYIKKGAEKWSFKTPTEPVVLDQKGCMYHPHVFGVMAGQPIKVRNSDPTLHNVHPAPKNNPEFNLGQPNQGMEAVKSFLNEEIMIPVKCDVHRWMQCYIGVLKHPFFAVTGQDGSFTIKLPAGTYTVEAWHEKLGQQTQDVTVADNESKEITFSYKAS